MSNNHTVLLFADHTQLDPILSEAGYAVIHPDDLDAAVRMCQPPGFPDIAVIACDHPDLAACQRLRSADAHLPILITIADEDEDKIEAAYAAGATDFVILPVRPAILLRRIQNLLSIRNVQEDLRVKQETFELALHAAEVGIWDWDMQADHVYYSDNWLRMLGYEPGELPPTSATWRALIHPDDAERVAATLEKHLLEGGHYEVEHRLKTKNGDWKWILSVGKVITRDAQGKPLRMAGTHRDVHHTIMMERALRLSEERHRIISNTISDYAYAYIVMEDGNLKKDWSTQAFHEITGYTFEEMDSNGFLRLIHPDDMGIAMQRFQNLLAGQVDVSEFRIITKSGDIRWLRDHGHPVIDDHTKRVIHIYGAAQDITQRKHDEEMLRQQAEELAARNEELDAFAYTVAHDLKNPIASMMGFSSLILKYHERMSQEKQLEYVQLIMESGYTLKSIINALLMLAGVSKMDNPEIVPLDMKTILEDSKRRLAYMTDERGAQIIIPDDLPVAVGYGPWVEEVWMNYLSNAVKYGGEPPLITVGGEVLADGFIRFYVQDNGKGLTEDEQQRVFTPFTRLNQVKVEGHGLGLSVVQRIVHRLGGEVGVSSSVGKGSKFTFTLPQAAPHQVP